MQKDRVGASGLDGAMPVKMAPQERLRIEAVSEAFTMVTVR